MKIEYGVEISRSLRLCLLVIFLGATSAWASDEEHEPVLDEAVERVEHDPEVFRDDPSYEDKPYDIEDQLAIYGGKRAVRNPRPMLELGRRIYESGPFSESEEGVGEDLNPGMNQFAIYGDIRTAATYNDFGGGNHLGQLSTRVNLDIDWKFTGTERLHAFIRPLDRAGGRTITRCETAGSLSSDSCEFEVDGNLDALFFEGDLGAITAGMTGEYVDWDLPFAVGLMPLLFQNGIWVEDAFTGLAVTLPARNSPGLDISNYDVTFFAAFDKVNTGALPGVDEDIDIFGVTSFLEATGGYWEMGYGYTDTSDVDDRFSYHNASIAFTRRYADKLSNSVRLVANFGQDGIAGVKSADGYVLLLENSLITSRPTTLVPYLNLFWGEDSPQSLARAVDAGGILKNTGITFESDGMSGFPTLDATARNTWGGAFGIEYLFDLDQQLVFELATVQDHGTTGTSAVTGGQYAAGVRYQRALSNAWIFRADATYIEHDVLDDFGGVRIEFRRKF